MRLNYLDKFIPGRTILLLLYYLPFLCYFLPFGKRPTIFYFKCRNFINKLTRAEHFPFDQLGDLLGILEKYAIQDVERKIAKDIILEIFIKESEKMNFSLLADLLGNFNPGTEHSMLNYALDQIPTDFYLEYFRSLNKENFSMQTLDWCIQLKHKFTINFQDKLSLILSLSDEFMLANKALIDSFVMHDLEQLITDPGALSDQAKIQLKQFISVSKDNLKFPDSLVQKITSLFDDFTMGDVVRTAFFDNEESKKLKSQVEAAEGLVVDKAANLFKM